MKSKMSVVELPCTIEEEQAVINDVAAVLSYQLAFGLYYFILVPGIFCL